MVAGAHGDHAACALLGRELGQLVEGAAFLERGGELQVLELEIDLRSRDLGQRADRKSTRLNSSHSQISYAVFCLKKKKTSKNIPAYIVARRLQQANYHEPEPPILTHIQCPVCAHRSHDANIRSCSLHYITTSTRL